MSDTLDDVDGLSSLSSSGLLHRAELEEHAERIRSADRANWAPHADVVCRFCRHDAHYHPDVEIGAAVCGCDAPYNYAHRACLHEYVFVTRATHCPDCQTLWRLDYERIQRIVSAGGRVRLVRAARQAATFLVALFVFLGSTLGWAYLLKTIAWVATGVATYPVLGVPALTVEPAFCLGDLVVGGVATFLSLVLLTGVYVVRKRLRRSYRRHRPRYTEEGDQDDEMSEMSEMSSYGRIRSPGISNSLETARALVEARLQREDSTHHQSATRQPLRAVKSVVFGEPEEHTSDDEYLSEPDS